MIKTLPYPKKKTYKDNTTDTDKKNFVFTQIHDGHDDNDDHVK